MTVNLQRPCMCSQNSDNSSAKTENPSPNRILPSLNTTNEDAVPKPNQLILKIKQSSKQQNVFFIPMLESLCPEQ